MKTNRQNLRTMIAIVAVTILVVAAAPFIGMYAMPLSEVFGSDPADSTVRSIFWNLRVPRVCLAFLVGSGLALSGMAFQALFRNPLTTPFTLGVASGASLGAAVYVWTGLSISLAGLSGATLFAFVGALAAILCVYGVARSSGRLSAEILLLTGVAISFCFTSVIMFLQYISDLTDVFRIVRWLMGDVSAIGIEPVLQLLPFILVGLVTIMALTRELNLLSVGEELAQSRGVAAGRVRAVLLVVTSLVVGAIVAMCGPIAFVGLMVPHTCRRLVGPDHRILGIASIFAGGLFLVLCDTVARTVVAPAQIPVGVITGLLGGPYFIALLLHHRTGDMGGE